jgi:hypothetical protein
VHFLRAPEVRELEVDEKQEVGVVGEEDEAPEPIVHELVTSVGEAGVHHPVLEPADLPLVMGGSHSHQTRPLKKKTCYNRNRQWQTKKITNKQQQQQQQQQKGADEATIEERDLQRTNGGGHLKNEAVSLFQECSGARRGVGQTHEEAADRGEEAWGGEKEEAEQHPAVGAKLEKEENATAEHSVVWRVIAGHKQQTVTPTQ